MKRTKENVIQRGLTLRTVSIERVTTNVATICAIASMIFIIMKNVLRSGVSTTVRSV